MFKVQYPNEFSGLCTSGAHTCMCMSIFDVHIWLLAERQSLNVSKTKLIMFHMPQKNVPSLKLSICNIKIEEVDHFNFLGLIIDKNMRWHTPVQKVINKNRNVNGILHKFKYVFPHILENIL